MTMILCTQRLVKHHQDLSAGAKKSRLVAKSPLPTANLFLIPDGSRTPLSRRQQVQTSHRLDDSACVVSVTLYSYRRQMRAYRWAID